MEFLIMILVDISEEVKVLKVIMTQLPRGFKRMQSNNNGNKQGNDEVASYRINI